MEPNLIQVGKGYGKWKVDNDRQICIRKAQKAGGAKKLN